MLNTNMLLWVAIGVYVIPGFASEPSSKPASPTIVYSGEETFIAESVGDNGDSGEEGIYGDDDNFVRFRNRLYLKVQGTRFDSALRFDTTLFHRPPKRVDKHAFRPGGEGYTTLNYDNHYDVSHLHGSVSLGHLKITMGDFHVSFGRGMALSLLKIDDLDEDNQLRGGRIDYRLPRKLNVTLVAGVVNAVNSDPLTRQIYEDDPLDRIVGSRFEWQLLDAISLGLHGVVMKPRYTDVQEISRERLYEDRSPGIGVMNGGASLEAHLEGVHLYLEGNGQVHENFRALGPVREESGAALFGEISWDLSPVGIKAEGLYYKRWLMEGPYRGVGDLAVGLTPLVYNHMVTLEPRFVPIKSMGNALGGRVGGNLFIERLEIELELKTTVIRYNGGLLPEGIWRDHPKTWAVHPILSLSKTFRRPAIRMTIEGGGRYEKAAEPLSFGSDNGTLFHIKSDLTIPVRGPHSVAVTAEWRRHRLAVTEGNDYTVTLASLGYRLSGRFDVTVAHEYSDEVVSGGHRLGNLKWMAPRHFAWAMGRLELDGIHDDITLRGFIGSRRGGIKCAGGVCRRYPDAVGAKIDVVLTF